MLFRRSNSMSPDEAAAALSRGDLQLVDVRESGELAAARVEGAMHIPLDELPTRLAELDPNRPVAFLCRSGRRSAMATRAAAKIGFDAANVKGGVLAWGRAGLPLSSDPRRGDA